MADEVPERRAGLKTVLVFLMLFAVLGDQSTAWLLPTWTLCVEEQF